MVAKSYQVVIFQGGLSIRQKRINEKTRRKKIPQKVGEKGKVICQKLFWLIVIPVTALDL